MEPAGRINDATWAVTVDSIFGSDGVMMDQLTRSAASPNGYLRQEHDSRQVLFEAQLPIVQRFLEVQARQLAEAVVQRLPRARFTLPDRVVVGATEHSEGQVLPIPPESREQAVGGWFERLTRTDGSMMLRQRLAELAQSSNRAIAASAELVRYAIVVHMVHAMLPDGRSVVYVSAEDEEIPTIPLESGLEPASAITAATDAIAEEGEAEREEGRGQLQVPYAPAARRFYLPQWVAFDDANDLLVNSVEEAEAHIASMQRFLAVLHMAVSIAPYMVADQDYQRKRYGMLGQLINQGRALARYKTSEIIRTIQQRAAARDLNRGLSLSLPYFDDQALQVRTHDMLVIPAGRIMFVPAFVVRAAREEQAKVAQDTRPSPSTRKHLLAELKVLEEAFVS
jgi:hypothetical protein